MQIIFIFRYKWYIVINLRSQGPMRCDFYGQDSIPLQEDSGKDPHAILLFPHILSWNVGS